MRTDRLREIDLLRAVALVAVALIHAGAWVTPAEAAADASPMAAVLTLARFCVPAFVFASGFLLAHVGQDRAIQLGPWLRRRWLRILGPWLCWTPVFLLADSLSGGTGPLGPWLAFGPGHLYFLLLMAQLSLLFPALPRHARRLGYWTAAAVALQLALMVWRTYGTLPGGWLAWPAVYLSHEEAPFWLGTFLLGCLTARLWPYLSRWERYWPAALAAAVVAAAFVLLEGSAIGGDYWRQGNAAYLWPSRLAQTMSWCLSLLWLGRRWSGAGSRLVRGLSVRSLGVYAVHPLFLSLLGPFTAPMPVAVRVPLLMATALAGAYATVALIARTRLGAFAMGDQARSSKVSETETRIYEQVQPASAGNAAIRP